MEIKRLNRIKAVLAEKGKTNIWLANELDKDPATISRWCQNAAQPSIMLLSKIAHVLDTDIRELLVPSKEK